MDTPFLVRERVEAGERLVADLQRAGVPVTVAFWLKPVDHDWEFHVASEAADDRADGRRFVQALPPFEPGGAISFLDLRLASPRERVVQDVLAKYRQYPQLFPWRYNGLSLGDVGIDAAYLYPPPAVPAA